MSDTDSTAPATGEYPVAPASYDANDAANAQAEREEAAKDEDIPLGAGVDDGKLGLITEDAQALGEFRPVAAHVQEELNIDAPVAEDDANVSTSFVAPVATSDAPVVLPERIPVPAPVLAASVAAAVVHSWLARVTAEPDAAVATLVSGCDAEAAGASGRFARHGPQPPHPDL